MANVAARLIFFIVSLFSCFNILFAQQVDSVLNEYANRFGQEKLHIHFDRSVYNKDETIYYKAYLLDEHNSASLSKNLYIDWYDLSGKLLKQTIAPIFLSTAKGSFDVPFDYKADAINVKAYTKWMLNFDPAFICNRMLSIHQPKDNKKHENNNNQTLISYSTHVQIYPEGGFAVAGLANHFAFKATDQFADPVSIKGVIKDNTGHFVDSVSSAHDGMGIFSLMLHQGEKYFLEWIDEHNKKGVSEILAQKQGGAFLHVLPFFKKALFTIERTANSGEAFKTMHLLVHKNQNLRYKIDFNMAEKKTISSEIPTDDLPTGIVQLTLFNAGWIPVAERIIFVNNQNHSFYPELKVTKKDLAKKGANQLEIFVPDTLLANMSVTVTDAGVSDQNEPTIFSDFLLSDEIRGKVNNPAYYFSNEGLKDKDKAKDSTLSAHLDLVMLTNGHRRFDWEKIAKGEMPDIRYAAETEYLQIKGKITGDKVIKSKGLLSLNVMLQTKDSSKSMFVIPVQKDGTFKQKDVFYYDTVQLFYNIYGEKQVSMRNLVKFENFLLNAEEKRTFFSLQQMSDNRLSERLPFDKSKEMIQTNSLFEEQDKLRETIASATLKNVVVTTRVKTKKQILDEFYTRGVFAGGGNNYTVDVEGDINAKSQNIWNYLQGKIPGLTVIKPGSPEPGIIWFSSGFEDNVPPALFLDEVPVDLRSLSSVDVAGIAYVKAFRPPFVGAFLNGVHGAIALYSKKGYSPVYKNISAEGLESSFLSGYTKFKEFVQRDFESTSVYAKPDYRATLYFNPFILTDKTSPSAAIDFINNDTSKKLKVVLEGIDAEGKMARVVKILE